MVLKVMIDWQNWELNQLAGFQEKLPRSLSGTGQTETNKYSGSPQQDSNRQKDCYEDPLPEEPRNC
jgi:hypothetical protein